MEYINVKNMSETIGKPRFVLVRENVPINTRYPGTVSVVGKNKKNVYVFVYSTGITGIGKIGKEDLELLRSGELGSGELEAVELNL